MKLSPTRTLISLVLLLTVVVPLSVAAAPAESARSYLVELRPGVAPDALTTAGFDVRHAWSELSAAQVVADSTQVAHLQAHAAIQSVEEDRILYALGHGPLPYVDGEYTWGLQAVHAPQAWALNAVGAGIKVCVLDTGIDYTHPAFFRNGVSIIKDSKNFVDDGHPDASDGNGHGTHVAGTIAGGTQADGSRIGVAPQVELYIARVLGDDGSGPASGIINGLTGV